MAISSMEFLNITVTLFVIVLSAIVLRYLEQLFYLVVEIDEKMIIRRK